MNEQFNLQINKVSNGNKAIGIASNIPGIIIFCGIYAGVLFELQGLFNCFGSYFIPSLFMGILLGIVVHLFTDAIPDVVVLILGIVLCCFVFIFKTTEKELMSGVVSSIIESFFHNRRLIYLADANAIELSSSCLFSSAIAVIMSIFIKHCNYINTIILAASAVAILIGIIGSSYWLILIYVACLLGTCLYKNRNNSCDINKSRVQMLVRIMSVFIAIVMVCCACFHASPEFEIKKNITNKVHSFLYELSDNYLPEGNFSKTAVAQSGETRLIVSSNNLQAAYIKGYCGDYFEQDSWRKLNIDELIQNEEIYSGLRNANFYGSTQISNVVKLLNKESNAADINISNISACSAYIYTPYGIITSDKIKQNILGDDELVSEGLKGERQYSFSVDVDAAFQSYQLLKDLVALDANELNEYRLCESNYRYLVYENYLGLSDQWQQSFESLLGTKKVNSTFEAKYIVYSFLVENCKYDSKAKYPYGDSSLEKFISGNASGSSISYASIATMMLRYLGVPARYVEGYVITPEMVSNTKNNTVELTDKSAHAWVEYYEDGIGWVVFEATPNLASVMPESEWEWYVEGDSEYVVDGSGDGVRVSDIVTIKETDPIEQDDPKDTPEDPVEPAKSYGWILVIIASMLLSVILIIVLRRFLILRKRAAMFNDKSSKSQAALRFANAMTILWSSGLKNNNEPLLACVGSINEWFSDENDCKHVVELNNKAVFSNKDLEDFELDEIKDFEKRTISIVNKRAKLKEKTVNKWIKCLY